MSKTVRVIGDTKAIKETLKKHGFFWNAEKSRWHKSVSDTQAEQLLNADTQDATLAAFQWKYRGCQVSVGDTVVFTSKKFATLASDGQSDPDALDADGQPRWMSY